MKHVTWQDEQGYKRCSLLRDKDSDQDAAIGIPVGPPDMEELDWELIKKELNNLLVDRELYTFNDIQFNVGALQSSILSVIRPKLLRLYKIRRTQHGP